MIGRTRAFMAAVVLLVLAAVAQAQGAFFLKSGDRVVFYGDSITDQRLYTCFAETFVLTRFPKLNVSFVHSGWGGDRVTGGGGGPIDKRLDRDVIAYKPTVMTIMLGMNDGSYRPFDQNIFDTYANGYRHIVDKMKAADPGIRITGIVPSPFDDVTRKPGWDPGYNAVLLRYGDFVKELASKESMTVADLNTGVVAALEKAYATDPSLAQKIVPDRVHPGPGGHLLMAEGLLKAWNAPPVVTSVEIDAAAKKVVKQEGAHVSGLKVDGGASWTEVDDCLPMPIDMNDATVALAVRSSDFVEALDQEPLKVTGLKAGNYTLKIDGEAVGSLSAEELAEGVNLATLPTPMAKQAATVHGLTWRHNTIHALRWRQVQVPLESETSPHMQDALKALDAVEADVVKEQREAARPKPHMFEVVAG